MTHLTLLSIRNFRNLESVELEANPQFNLFGGENASGKTSLLEAIYCLSSNRSFRTKNLQYLIQQDSDSLTVFAKLLKGPEVPESKLGLMRDAQKRCTIKIDAEVVKRSSELAHALPLISIDPTSFELLDGAPANRRAILDWLVFHVKPSFLNHWKDYQRCLKQRNMALRSGKITRLDLMHWDKLLAASALEIERERVDVLNQINEELLQSLASDDRAAALGISLTYRSGWARTTEEVPLESRNLDWYVERLTYSFDQDLKQGFTQVGSHRHDIKIRSHKLMASEILSRGQKKTLILSVYLCLARLLERLVAKKPVFLLDDLPSELDERNLEWMCKEINILGSQSFITAVDHKAISDLALFKETACSVFHVKHGTVEQIEFNKTNT